MFTMFLNKSDQRKVAFFRCLESAELQMETKESLAKQLSLSEFLINKTIEELNTDFRTFELDHLFRISTDGTTVALHEEMTNNSEALVTCYLQRSTSFALVEEMFFERIESISDFSINHYVSHTSVYSKLKRLKKLLATYEIEICRDFRLVGNEASIRSFLLLFFMRKDNSIEEIFPKHILNQCDSLLTSIDSEPIGSGVFCTTMKKRDLYTAITLWRIEKGHTITNSEVMEENTMIVEDLYNRTKSWVTNELLLDAAIQVDAEVHRLVTFYLAEGVFDVSEEQIVLWSQFVSEWNESFLDSVKENFPLSCEQQNLIERDLTLLHYKLKCFPMFSAFTYLKADVSYFRDTYPEYFSLCKDYILDNRGEDMIWRGKEYLFFSYVMVLANRVPLKDILPPIHICIDFSYGQIYNQMIQSHIEKVSELHLIFQDEPDAFTQLILSDSPYLNKQGVEQIIWLSPPRPVDWANLSTILTIIRLREVAISGNHQTTLGNENK